MSRKRRTFDIDLPDDAINEPVLETKSATRGPMATAIGENADALKARKEAADAIRQENDALAHELVALREAGHVVAFIPLEEVHTSMLVRDRMPGEDEELEELVTSIRELGLSNPIRVMERPDGAGYELVQGFRRWSAYKTLSADKVSGDWSKIPALVMKGDTDIEGLYRRMVDENVIRKDLSFAEMAYAAQNFAADKQTEAGTLKDAVAALFQSAPYSKRNYIRTFAFLLDELSGFLQYPTKIPRALGINLAKELKANPAAIEVLKDTLEDAGERTAEQEQEILQYFATNGSPGLDEELPFEVAKEQRPKKTANTKTTFHIKSRAGQVKCTAAQGRLEIKVDRDFSSIDRARLEQAVADLIDGLS